MLIKALSRKTAVGLDISDRSIEAVWLGGSLSRPKYLASARRELPGNIIENGKILSLDELKKELKETLASAAGEPITAKSAVLSIPTQAVISDLVILDIAIPEQDIENEIYRHFLLKHKIKKATHTFSWYQIPTESREKNAFFVAAAGTETINEYVSVLKSLKINAVAVDFEALATARAILPPNIKRRWGLLDSGANQTTFSIFDGHTLILSESIPIAGDQFTAIIMNALRIPGVEAEKLKSTALQDDKARSALEAKLEPIVELVQDSIDFSKSEYQLSPSHILTAGGSSLIEGFDEWWQKRLSLPVERARAFTTFPAIVPSETFYLNAIGLALRGIEKEPKRGFSLLPERSSAVKTTVKAAAKPTSIPEVATAKETTAVPDNTLPKIEPKLLAEIEGERPSIEPTKETDKKELQISLAPEKVNRTESVTRNGSSPEAQNRRVKIWLAILMLTIAAFPIAWLIAKGNLNVNLGDLGQIADPDNDSTVRESILTAFTAEVSAENVTQGQILTATYEITADVTPTGTREEDGYATGTATIYNKTTTRQTIIANSRLETADGEVFKTQSRIEVPAGSSKTVTIKAADTGTDGNITPQKLTFVTLPDLASKLYAETSATLTGGVVTTNYIQATDLETAEGTILETIEEYPDTLPWNPEIDETAQTFVPKIASYTLVSSSCEVDQVATGTTECTFTYDLIAVALDTSWFDTTAESALYEAQNAEERNEIYQLSETTYTITYNEETGTATVTVAQTYLYS